MFSAKESCKPAFLARARIPRWPDPRPGGHFGQKNICFPQSFLRFCSKQLKTAYRIASGEFIGGWPISNDSNATEDS
jgi:hypothetical protein